MLCTFAFGQCVLLVAVVQAILYVGVGFNDFRSSFRVDKREVFSMELFMEHFQLLFTVMAITMIVHRVMLMEVCMQFIVRLAKFMFPQLMFSM